MAAAVVVHTVEFKLQHCTPAIHHGAANHCFLLETHQRCVIQVFSNCSVILIIAKETALSPRRPRIGPVLPVRPSEAFFVVPSSFVFALFFFNVSSGPQGGDPARYVVLQFDLLYLIVP